ncbi:MAG: polyprenyl synthetase family protein [Chloroflexota bacterium]|nr:polyprenyl synthetase family protein [Chloroflexota bacterium]
MNFTQTMEKKSTLKPVEEEVQEVSELLRESAALNYPMLQALLKAIIEAGGKRLRPMMALLAARLPGQIETIEHEKLLQVAAAVEMLHTATLVHDDTIDEALLRRGSPTLNSVLSGSTVILVGDYLFAQSAILITKPGNPNVVKIFAECLATICDGELTQIFSSRSWKQSKEEYYKRIYCKTAVLFATACELGAIMGKADEALVAKMRRFGHLLGMGFQIIDDIIDFKPAAITGKATGGDLRQGIVTLPTMTFFEKGEPTEVEFVKKLVQRQNASEEEISRAVELIGASGAFEIAYEEAKDFILRAKELLNDVPESDSKTRLLEIADYSLAREK